MRDRTELNWTEISAQLRRTHWSKRTNWQSGLFHFCTRLKTSNTSCSAATLYWLATRKIALIVAQCFFSFYYVMNNHDKRVK